MQYENGLPTSSTPVNTTETNWESNLNLHQFYILLPTDGAERTMQDTGFDGLDNEAERMKFGTNFINPITNIVDPASVKLYLLPLNQFQGNQASSIVETLSLF